MIVDEVEIKQIDTIQEDLNALSVLLIQVVEDGASLGFLSPLIRSEAINYWENVINPEVILYTAMINRQIVGSVQIHFCTKKNGEHRVEIARLMTHPNYRRRGIGQLLMKKAEEDVKLAGKSLIVLDTREGDPSNRLYTSLGYIQAGRIPNYAKSSNGELHATIYYYKDLNA